MYVQTIYNNKFKSMINIVLVLKWEYVKLEIEGVERERDSLPIWLAFGLQTTPI